jgi:hypothetical protein
MPPASSDDNGRESFAPSMISALRVELLICEVDLPAIVHDDGRGVASKIAHLPQRPQENAIISLCHPVRLFD